MFSLIWAVFLSCTRLFCARSTLLLENLALRQQLAVLKRRQPRARLGLADKLFWVVVRRLWSGWKSALIVVKPETVIHWHRTAFQIYWRWISHFKGRTGRKQISKDMRDLIFRMVAENRTWGAPRIHGELLMLGFAVSEQTISRWMRRAPRDPEPARRWLAFLRNHREAAIAPRRLNKSHRPCGDKALLAKRAISWKKQITLSDQA